MSIDKELYRQAMQHYEKWNELKLKERAQRRTKPSPQKLWEQYAELWQFAVSFSPSFSEIHRRQRYREWGEYYQRVMKMEKWRRAHGR